MRKINTLFSENSQLKELTKNVQAHQNLQQLWLAVAPKNLSQASFASSLINGRLTVYADSAIVANKIKLIHMSLLAQLQSFQKNDPLFRVCKVTAITVKVQVKSHPKPIIKMQRKLSDRAASSLKILANSLGESPLAAKLNSLANKP
jgi:hypothetical protein